MAEQQAPKVDVHSHTDVHVPENPTQVTIRQEAPQVHVAPEVFIDRAPEPEVVDPPKPTSFRRLVERDELGRIAVIIDEAML